MLACTERRCAPSLASSSPSAEPAARLAHHHRATCRLDSILCTGPCLTWILSGAGTESPLSETCLALMGAPTVPNGSSWSHRILQLAFAFFSLVLLNTYTAGLAAQLTVQALYQPLQTLGDLARV